MKPPNEAGLFTHVPREDYDRIDRINWSALKHMKRSPFHFREAAREKVDKDTDAMRVGRATHIATLEPERFRATHAVWDGGRRYGKEWDKFCEKNAGYEILTEDQYQQVVTISKAVLSHEIAARWLRAGSSEVTLQWTHLLPDLEEGRPFPIECKARLDFAPNVAGVVDLKTTRDASPEAFGRQAWNLDYLGQAAMYQDGYAAVNGGVRMPYVIVAVESAAPHAVQVYRVPERLLKLGRAMYVGFLETLAECRRQNRWPGYSDGELELDVPRWAQAQNDDDDQDVTGLGLVMNE